MKLFQKSLIASSLAMASVAAIAADANFYMGLGFTKTEIDTGVSALTGTASLDEDDTGYKLFAGTNIDKNIFVEAHYADLGKATLKGNNGDRFNFEGSTYQFTANNVSISAEGETYGLAFGYKFLVSEELVPYVKLGVHNWEMNSSITSSAGSVSLNEDGTDEFYGFGAEYKLSDQVSIRGEFERFKFDSEDVDSMNLSVISKF